MGISVVRGFLDSRRATLLIAASVLAATLATTGIAQARPDAKAVLSPVAFQVIDRPAPVLGADGRMHLAYELEVINQAPMDVTIHRIAPRAQGATLGPALTGAELAERTRLNDGGTDTTLGGGKSATVFLDTSYVRKRKTPPRISHAITMSWTTDTGQAVKQTILGVSSKVSQRRAVKVKPPLRGRGWVAGSGCCTLNPHRGATLAIDGTIRVPERFAIDFVRLNASDRLFTGPLTDLDSYAYYGARIHSVARGTVVRVRDNLPEQVPGELPAGATIQMAGGNHVVVRIGKGRYAFYAHMQRGSIRVKRGDRVRVGQVLGRLGNTGNTDAPHLHFHVMNSPLPLQSSGLPFTFDYFRGRGKVTDPVALLAGEDPKIQRNRLNSRYRDSLTMDYQIVDFRK